MFVLKEKKMEEIYFPKRKTKQSAGYDVYLTEPLTLEPWERVKCDVKLDMEVPEGKSVLLFLRSSAGIKHYIRLIDGHKKYIATKVYPKGKHKVEFFLMNVGNQTKVFEKGERIVQLVIVDDEKIIKLLHFNFEKVNVVQNDTPFPMEIFDKEDGSKIIANKIDIEIKPHEIIQLPLGIKAPIEAESVLFMELNKEGLGDFKDSLWLPNGVGVIDSDYVLAENEGHIFMYLENRESKKITIPSNTPLFMAKNVKFYSIENEIKPTEVRTGGEGSTGN